MWEFSVFFFFFTNICHLVCLLILLLLPTEPSVLLWKDGKLTEAGENLLISADI